MPYYRFTLRDRNGQLLQFRPRCGASGLWADTKWPHDYLVEIKPGATYSKDVGLGGYYDIPRTGAYMVSFEYVYQPTKESFAPPPRAWRGTVRAPDIIFNFKGKWS